MATADFNVVFKGASAVAGSRNHPFAGLEPPVMLRAIPFSLSNVIWLRGGDCIPKLVVVRVARAREMRR
jgi:hypothetical protein